MVLQSEHRPPRRSEQALVGVGGDVVGVGSGVGSFFVMIEGATLSVGSPGLVRPHRRPIMILGVIAIGIPHHDHEVVARLVVLIPSRHSVRVKATVVGDIPRQRFGVSRRVDGDVMAVPVADLHFAIKGGQVSIGVCLWRGFCDREQVLKQTRGVKRSVEVNNGKRT